MESRVKILGHAVHQLLIVFPLGLLSTAALFDGLALVTGRAEFEAAAFWMIVAGVAGGLVAAPFGTIDWLAIPKGTRAKRVGLLHGASAVTFLLLFAASGIRRYAIGDGDTIAVALSFAGFAVALLVGWTGGELVGRLGVAVYDGAHLNSPNSLSRRPASDDRVVTLP